MKFYTKREKSDLWIKDPMIYIELAHQYLCCELPEFSMCLACEMRQCKYYQHVINLCEQMINVPGVEDE